jgi:hypothetical protein
MHAALNSDRSVDDQGNARAVLAETRFGILERKPHVGDAFGITVSGFLK